MELRIRHGKTESLVMTALMMSLILIGTMMFKIPVPMTQGYIHLGDAMIYLAVFILGKKNGTVAAALGSALGDIIGGYAFWAPWTLAIKGLMAFVTALLIEYVANHVSPKYQTVARVGAMTAGGVVMCFGYLIAERFIYGNWPTAIIAVPWNIAQFAIGIAIAILIGKGLEKAMN